MRKRTDITASVNLEEVSLILEFWGDRVRAMTVHGSRKGAMEAYQRLDYWFTMRDALREEMDNGSELSAG